MEGAEHMDLLHNQSCLGFTQIIKQDKPAGTMKVPS